MKVVTPLPLAGLVLLSLLTLAWGLTWPAMKLGLTEIGPWTFRTICLVTGGIGLLAIARASGYSLTIPGPERLPVCLVALFNITGWHMFSAYGLTLIHATRAVIIAYTMPLWAVIFGRILLGEPLSRGRGVALLLGLAGLAVLVGPEVAVFWKAPVGTLFILAAAASWAGGTVLLKRFRWEMPTVVLTAWQVILGAVPVVLGQLMLEPRLSLASLSLNGLLGTAFATFVGVVFCQYAWFRVVQMLPAAVAAISTLGIPVVGVFFSWLVLGEPAGLSELAALALIVPALLLVLVGAGVPASE